MERFQNNNEDIECGRDEEERDDFRKDGEEHIEAGGEEDGDDDFHGRGDEKDGGLGEDDWEVISGADLEGFG